MTRLNTLILEELIKSTLLEQKGRWYIAPLNPNSKLYKKIITDPNLIKGFVVKLNREKDQKLYLYHVSGVIKKYKGDSIRKFDTGEYNGKPIIYVYGPDKKNKKDNKLKRNVYIMYRPNWLTDDMIDPKNNVVNTPAISHVTLDAAFNKSIQNNEVDQNDVEEYNDVEKIIASDDEQKAVEDNSQIKTVKNSYGTYVGEMKGNQFHGHGTFTYNDGDEYTGEFKEGKRDGLGTYSWADGKKYEGDWLDNNKHGNGILIDPTGLKYDGQWKDDKLNGEGILTSPSGDILIGKGENGFVDGKLYNGTYIWADGDKQKIKDGKDDGPVIKKGEETDVPKEILGFATGKVNSNKVYPGGINGDWDGSMIKALEILKHVTGDYSRITSQKRNSESSVWKAGSDHSVGQTNAYGIDLGVTAVATGSTKDKQGDLLYNKINKFIGSTLSSGTYDFFDKDGYSYQILWRVKDHFSHVHIGVRKGSRANENTTTIKPKETYTITDSGFKGTYTGPEFDKSKPVGKRDVAHQFSNTAADVIGKKLKELYKEGKYSRVDFSGIVMETIGMKSGTVTYKLTIPFKSVASKCLALTSFDHVGGWGHEPDLNKRKTELKSALMSGDSLIISEKKTTPEGLEEYWIQWRNKKTQAECGKASDDTKTKNIKTKNINITDVKNGYKRPKDGVSYTAEDLVFKKGNTYGKDSIKIVQELLKIGGYDIGTSGDNKDGIDDDFGGSLEKAVIKFQKDNNITPPNGIIDKATFNLLYTKYRVEWAEKRRKESK